MVQLKNNIKKITIMKITKVRDVESPRRGTEKSAGIDFFVPNDLQGEITLSPGQTVNLPSGIHAKVPEGHALIAFNKSGVSVNKRLQVGACVIDEDYQGEIHLHVVNIGQNQTKIVPGEKLMQFILIPVSYANIEIIETVEELYGGEVTARGASGFGSTNKTTEE